MVIDSNFNFLQVEGVFLGFIVWVFNIYIMLVIIKNVEVWQEKIIEINR